MMTDIVCNQTHQDEETMCFPVVLCCNPHCDSMWRQLNCKCMAKDPPPRHCSFTAPNNEVLKCIWIRAHTHESTYFHTHKCWRDMHACTHHSVISVSLTFRTITAQVCMHAHDVTNSQCYMHARNHAGVIRASSPTAHMVWHAHMHAHTTTLHTSG